jgi:serine protease
MDLRRPLVLSLVFLSACGGNDETKKRSLPLEGNGCAAITTRGLASLGTAGGERPARRFLVKMKNGPGLRAMAAGGRLSLSAAAAPVTDGLFVVNTAEATTPSGLAASLPAGAVDYVEEDGLVRADYLSDDAGLAKQWAHDKVGSPAAWDISRGDASVVVAVLDSGVDYTHEDLAPNIWTNPGEIPDNGIDDDGDGYVDDVHGWNFVSDTNDPQSDDKSNHGTHVAGTIGAVGNNGIGISGHAPLVKIMPLKFLGSNGAGYKSDAIRGIDYAIRHGAKIINNSWGSGERSAALSEAISRAQAAGILFVAAAGNSGLNNDRFNHFPSNYSHDNIVRVAASDKQDRFASFSNYGPTRVDLAAPGVSIYSTRNGNRYQSLSGTSMATPLVSGVLATMMAARPDLNYAQLKGALLDSVDAIPGMAGKSVTGGRVNAARALSLITGLPADWVPSPHPVSDCR